MALPTSFAPSLATETWQNILQNLALRPLELEQDVPSPAFRCNRSTLRQLCLTSRRLRDMARPYLYETVVIFADMKYHLTGNVNRCADAASAVLLLRSLAHNPALRPLTRNLAIPITLTAFMACSKMACREIWDEWAKQSTSLALEAPVQHILSTIGLDPKHNGPVDPKRGPGTLDTASLARKVVAALLCLTGSVETLLLQGLPSEFDGDLDELDTALGQLIGHAEIGPLFMPTLKTLQIQTGSAASQLLDARDPVFFQSRLGSPLLNLPGLTRLDLSYAWVNELDTTWKAQQGLAQLEEINLVVAAEPASIDALIQKATCLKSLSLGLSEKKDFPDQEGDLNTAILRRAETLETLALDTTGCRSEHAANHLGPLEKWTCLPQMRNLKKLSVEPHLLLDWLNANTWPLFFNKLPPNLEELTLLFTPENGEDLLRIWARSGVGAILRASPEKWRSKLPRMRHVRLEPLPYSTRATETLKSDLQLAGIALSWKEHDVALDFAGLSLH